MTTKVSELRPIDVFPGVNPSTDRTSSSTPHWTYSDKIRFKNGYPLKIGGWKSVTFSGDAEIEGKARTVFSARIAGNNYFLIGTHKHVYNLSGSRLTNITPLKTTAVAAADSLDTLYGTLGNDPVTTVSGSNTVTITDTAANRLRAGDSVTLTGFSGTLNGIPDTDLNNTFVIRSASSSSYTVLVATAATSSGSGGGASVVRATGLIRLNDAAHGLVDGDRIKVADAATTGGVTNTVINAEHIIRNVDTNYFEFMTSGTATSSVSAGGGVNTEYYPELDDGFENENAGQGYGMGLYGVGLYGTALLSSTARNMATIWIMDKFGDLVTMTQGQQTGVYSWDGSTQTAPVLVANAPTAVNYAFVSDNVLVTFGADNIENRIRASDQGNITQWTASSLNSVFADDVEGAGRFISHVSVPGNNLIFTENQTYTFRKIPRDSGVWEIKLKDPSVGIISPMARVAVNGVGYWMSDANFHMWRGGNVEIIPSNNPEIRESTILRYVFDNLNYAQRSKIFAWHNPDYNEIWWHYPSIGSNEPDRIARLCLNDYTWSPDTMDRTAGEYPVILTTYPHLVSSSGILYQHENGLDDDTSPITFTLTTNDRVLSKDMTMITGLVPDSIQTGNVTVTVRTRKFPQSTASIFNQPYTVTPTTEEIAMRLNGRLWNYTISGAALNQNWFMGNWFESIQKAGSR